MNIKKERTYGNTRTRNEAGNISQADEKLTIQRGDIVYVSPAENDVDGDNSIFSHGYAIVCSNNSNNLFDSVLEVVFISKKKKGITLPTHFWIKMDDIAYVVHCEQIASIKRDRIERRKKQLSKAEIERLNQCLKVSLGL